MTVDDASLDTIFRNARTVRKWTDRPVAEATLRAVYDLLKLGPTSGNCSPARIVFVASAAGKEKLRPCLIPSNIEKTMAAPVTAVIGHDLEFYDELPRLYPFEDARSWFVGNQPPEVGPQRWALRGRRQFPQLRAGFATP